MGTDYFDAVIQVNYFLQDIGNWLFAPMEWVSYLGLEDFYALMLPLIIWLYDYGLGIRVGMMLSISAAINILFQAAIPSPRPYWYDPGITRYGTPEMGYSFPSGHAQVPFSVYGLIATKVKGKLGVGIWVLIALIGLSRPILGMHYFTDVLAGWVVGGLLLWLFLKYENPVKDWFGSKSTGLQVFFVFLVTLTFIFASTVINNANEDRVIPAEWVNNAEASHLLEPAPTDDPLNPYDINRVITPMGTLFGVITGMIWLNKQGGFDASGTPRDKILRTILGLIGVVIFWMWLGTVFPREEDLISYVLRYFRYTLTGFWIAGLAPFLFVKWKLAKPKE